MSRMSHIAPESWPGLAEHMRAAFLAEQAAAREALKSQEGIEERQAPENRSVMSWFTQFNQYGWGKGK